MHPDATSPTATPVLALRLDEASRAVGLSRSTLYELIKSGSLKSIKVAGRRLIMLEDLQAFLRAAETP